MFPIKEIKPAHHIFFDALNEKFFTDKNISGNSGMFIVYIGSVTDHVRAMNMLDKLNDNKKSIIKFLNIPTLTSIKRKVKKKGPVNKEEQEDKKPKINKGLKDEHAILSNIINGNIIPPFPLGPFRGSSNMLIKEFDFLIEDEDD